MAALRSLLSGLTVSAVLAAGIAVPAHAAPAPAAGHAAQPPGRTRTALVPHSPTGAGASAVPVFGMSPMVLAPPSGANGINSGNRKAASMVSRHLTDLSSIGWNPTNGNLVLTGQLLHVKGAGRDLAFGFRYNGLNDVRPTLSVGHDEGSVIVGADNSVTYTAADGGTYKFVPSGSAWTMPPGLNASITSFSTSAVDIRFNDTGYTNEYTKDAGGASVLSSEDDQNPASPNKITYTYAGGLLSTINDTVGGRPVTFYYLDSRNPGQPSKITDDSLSRTILIEYAGPNGAMSKITDTTGAVMTFGYGGTNSQITTITDGRGTVTTLAYDTSLRLSQATYATGKTEQSIYYQYAYPGSTQSTAKDPNNNTTTYNHTVNNQVASITDPLGHTSQAGADAHDDKTSGTDALSNNTTYAYNANNSLSTVTAPAGATGGTGAGTTLTYPANPGDPLSNYQPATSVSSEGNTTNYSYDANTNRLYQTTTPGTGGGAGGTPTLNYQGDTAGTSCGAKKGELCKSADGNGNVTSYGYDTNGNPTTITRPTPLGTVANTYDAASRLISSTDGKGQTALYDYDNNDRLIQIDHGVNCASLCVTYTYDQAGNLTQAQDDNGNTTYTYDAQNRITSKTDTNTVTTSVTYDGASNMLSYADPTGTVTYAYDAANRLATLAEPGGSCPAPASFTSPNTTKCTGFDYDNANRRTAVKYPNWVSNITTYDNASRITRIAAWVGSGSWTSRSYTYTTNGTKDGALRKTATDDYNHITTTYTYDPLNRLSSDVTGTTTNTWTYDKNGNRTVDTTTGTANVYSAFNAADELCWSGASAGTCASPPGGATTFSYDANGNTTAAGPTTQSYNVFDQFTSNTSGGTTTPYTYLAPRNTERLTAGSDTFVNGILGITRRTNGGTVASFIRDPQGNLISMRTSAGSFYYTTDALGSVLMLTDTSASPAGVAFYTYDSWGNTTSTGTQAATNPWTYAGGYNDTASNTIKFGARYYNPARGRFTQADPSGQSANRYVYTGANPVNNTDPSGYFFACGSTLCPEPGNASYCGPSVGCAPPIGPPRPGSTLQGAISCYVGGYAFLLGLIFNPVGVLTWVAGGARLLGCG